MPRCRDAGPLFAFDANSKPVVSHIRFNGWGGKQVHRRDGKIAQTVARRLGLRMVASGLTGEAGAAEYDGHGTLIAHDSSSIATAIPEWIAAWWNGGSWRPFGADRAIWSKGIYGQDITDCHIDSLARFTAPGRVLLTLPDTPDRRDPFHMAALDMHDALVSAGLQVEVIPEPNRRRVKTRDFVASYANFNVCNGAVIAAQFGDTEADQIAAGALARHYPAREVVQLNVDPLGELDGGIHCATQQMPA